MLSFCSFVLCSCREDSDPGAVDVAKLEEKEAKLKELNLELERLRVLTKAQKTDPPQVPIDVLRKELESKKAELARLEEEFEVLQKAKDKADQELENYRTKFPLEE